MDKNNHLEHGLGSAVKQWRSMASAKVIQINTLFLKHQQGKVTALIVYVDDMIITGDDTEEIAKL